MADLDHQPTLTVEDDQPIALRRKRRRSAGLCSPLRSNSIPRTSHLEYGISTPPSTPKRLKKQVRFFDPGSPIGSSGLTPFIRRTSLGTPTSRRRGSSSSRLSNRAEYNAPLSGEVQFASLRQVLDGRVKRRLKRNRLSEEINTIEWDKRHEARGRKLELERLREELAARDLEVQSMRNDQGITGQIEGEPGMSVITFDTQSTKIQELEQVIAELKAELSRKEVVDDDATEDADWALAAKDPFNFDDEDDMMITNYDDEFGNSEAIITTPTRLNTSFPSPPSTAPNTPSRSASWASAGIQTALPIVDPEKDLLAEQLQELQTEVSKLTASVAFTEDNHLRLAEKLSDYLPIYESHDHTSLDSALDNVLTQLALSQSHILEHQNAFSALRKEVGNLGFPASGPEEAIATIAKQFRQARLDLEYLTPGEVVEGFENEKLLGMLTSRIKVLLQKVKRNDETIDEYHEQEVSLRKQLSTRISVTDSLHKELYLANSVVGDLRGEIEEKDISNERLQSALEGYRQEISSLEKLIEQMEKDGNNIKERLQDEVCRHDTTRISDEGKDMMVMELERRLAAALQAVSTVQEQLNALSASNAEKNTTIEQLQCTASTREQINGNTLALRDAQISDLRSQIDHVNKSLKNAHSTILSLRTENQHLSLQVENEREHVKSVVKDINEKAAAIMQIGFGFINSAGDRNEDPVIK